MRRRPTPPTTPPPPEGWTPRAIRKASGLSLVRVAGLLDVGVTTVRIFEIDSNEVHDPALRALCTEFYGHLLADLTSAA